MRSATGFLIVRLSLLLAKDLSPFCFDESLDWKKEALITLSRVTREACRKQFAFSFRHGKKVFGIETTGSLLAFSLLD